MSGILLILLIIGFVIWRKSENSKSSSRSISIEKENLDDWYQDKRKADILKVIYDNRNKCVVNMKQQTKLVSSLCI